MATRISKNFCLEEFLLSSTAERLGIKNVPSTQQVANLCALVHNVIQPLRDAMGHAVKIGSGYRCPKLNAAVGGVGNSQHLTGEAADLCIDADRQKGRQWFTWIKAHCDFDQLIWETSKSGSCWVHVSFRSDGKNRKEVIDGLLKN